MKIIKIEPRNYLSNTYILTADGKTAVVIDPAESSILNELSARTLKCEYVLLTHGHFDHVGGCRALAEAGAKVLCSEEEAPLIFSKEYLGIFGGVNVPQFEISRTIKDGETFELCGIKFTAMLTKGHTKGGMCYIADKNIFTGDTLFFGSVGRWDLPTGNFTELKASLKKLAALKGDYKVYSGHGEDTKLSREKKYNSFMIED